MAEKNEIPFDIKDAYIKPALHNNELLLNIINDILDY